MSKKSSQFTLWSDLRFLLRKSRRLLKAYLQSVTNPATYARLGDALKADSLKSPSLNQQALEQEEEREQFNFLYSGGNPYSPIDKNL